MKLFTHTDYSFCNCKECNKKERCMRNVLHYPQWQNKVLSYILIDSWKKCAYFINGKLGGDKLC